MTRIGTARRPGKSSLMPDREKLLGWSSQGRAEGGRPFVERDGCDGEGNIARWDDRGRPRSAHLPDRRSSSRLHVLYADDGSSPRNERLCDLAGMDTSPTGTDVHIPPLRTPVPTSGFGPAGWTYKPAPQRPLAAASAADLVRQRSCAR
ncbi:hypothetical protein CDD83_5547 [Cordyceps sp. RAO-2017]|nr:hypothetical protein CDD83_5547 [Cordyceps sp. RAO-2017]